MGFFFVLFMKYYKNRLRPISVVDASRNIGTNLNAGRAFSLIRPKTNPVLYECDLQPRFVRSVSIKSVMNIIYRLGFATIIPGIYYFGRENKSRVCGFTLGTERLEIAIKTILVNFMIIKYIELYDSYMTSVRFSV